jgi:two-component system, sensor histidine kinase and response regulator
MDKTNKVKKDMTMEECMTLQAEIQALRMQIDRMAGSNKNLIKQNGILKEQVLKLEVGKEELEKLQNQKDDLFSIIIHDIKNPASLIKGLVELLSSYDLNAHEQKEIISDIANTTSKIVKLSQEVTKIISLEAGKIELELDTFNMNHILEDTIRVNRVAADVKNIKILHDLDPDLPEITADPQKMQEVIENLVSNAIKFNYENGYVRVKSYVENRHVIVSVSDNGQGLSETDIKKAFSKATKLSAKPTGGESSTGLGLWIIKKIVERHKGRVWVKSALSKGSTFYASVPLHWEPETDDE